MWHLRPTRGDAPELRLKLSTHTANRSDAASALRDHSVRSRDFVPTSHPRAANYLPFAAPGGVVVPATILINFAWRMQRDCASMSRFQAVGFALTLV